MDRTRTEAVENMNSNFEGFHHILQWELIFLPRNIFKYIDAFIGVGVLFVITGEDSILDWSLGNSTLLPIERYQNQFVRELWRGCKNCDLWALSGCSLEFIKGVSIIHQDSSYRSINTLESDRIKSTENLVECYINLTFLGGQIENCKPKNQ